MTQPQKRENSQISQQELIILVQQTIAQLDKIAQQLNTESFKQLPSQGTVEMLVKTTNAITVSLEDSSGTTPIVETPPNQLELTSDQKEIPEIKTDEESHKVAESNALQAFFANVLSGIRNILPTALSDRLPNWGITGILTVIIVGVLSTSVLLLPQPISISKIVQTPVDDPQPHIVETPFQLESPESPQPVKIAPPPLPKLTPEQSLITAIQQEVTDLTNQYPTGLIGTIEADFSGSRLIVTMGEQWYELPQRRQDTLANTILNRAQKLDFRKLEMLDNQGTLIARSPVVGDQIIILQRQRSFS
ncbi:MAG: hypothetical protein AAGF26_19420 [Cyanobacteria bacterium P01_G01_bin.49]